MTTDGLTLGDLYAEIEYQRDWQPDPEYTPETVLTTAERAEFETWLDMVDAQLETCPDCDQRRHVAMQQTPHGG